MEGNRVKTVRTPLGILVTHTAQTRKEVSGTLAMIGQTEPKERV